MVAEQGVGHGVEDRRLAAAVEAGQHPERGAAVETDLLLFLVTEKALELDALRDHCLHLPQQGPRPAPAPPRAARRRGCTAPDAGSRAPCPRSSCPRRLAHGQRPAQRPRLVHLAVVPAREDVVQLPQRFLAVVHAGRVGAADPHQGALCLGIPLRQRRQLRLRHADFHIDNRRRVQRQDRRFAEQTLRPHVEQHNALFVVLFAKIDPLDAAAVADVRLAAEELRLVDVAQRDVGEVVQQAHFLEQHVFFRGEAEQRRQVAALHGDVGAEHGRQSRVEAGGRAHGVRSHSREGPHQVAVFLVEALVRWAASSVR